MTGNIRFFSAGPLSVLAIVLLIGIILVLIPLLFLGIIGAAFTRLGLSWIAALALVLLMLAGSFVNIPVYRIKRDTVRATPMDSGESIMATPCTSSPIWETVVSVNVGGGILPVCIALYMIYQAVLVTGQSIIVPIAVSSTLVTIVSFLSTRDVTSLGFRVPFLMPALTALLAGMLLAGGTGLAAAVTALAGGVIGTITGGNIAHLYRARDLEVPEVSVGGSGSFTSVFLCCILPALLA